MLPTPLEIERRRQGLSATALARRMGVALSAVSAVERCRRQPSPEFQARAARALGMEVRQVFPDAASASNAGRTP